jgi:nucleoside-diphosphate kinase
MPGTKVNEETFLFVVEYFDPMPRLKRQYLLKLYTEDMDVEMVDLRSKKMFLKRSPCPPHLKKEDFFIGGKVLLFARELDIVEYGDGKTRTALQHQLQQSIMLLPFDTQAMWGTLIETLIERNIMIAQAKSVMVPPEIANACCNTLKSRNNGSLQSPNGVLILVLQGEDGINVVQGVVSQIDRDNALFVSSNEAETNELRSMLLNADSLESNVTLDSCTCCIVKPHAVRDKLFGKILSHILSQQYEISAMTSIFFERPAAEEFLEVYQGVVPEYSDHVVEFCGGMCIAMELRAQDAVSTFRQTAGPWDVEMAKELRPDTLRGLYGIDRVRNAVHCTDLESDASAECEYVFKLLA